MTVPFTRQSTVKACVLCFWPPSETAAAIFIPHTPHTPYSKHLMPLLSTHFVGGYMVVHKLNIWNTAVVVTSSTIPAGEYCRDRSPTSVGVI